MPYINSAERKGREEAITKQKQTLQRIIEVKFGSLNRKVSKALNEASVDRLQEINFAILTAHTLEDIF